MAIVVVMVMVGCSSSPSSKSGSKLTFSTDFPSSAASQLHVRQDGKVEFSIPSEPGGGEYLWFNFNVTGGAERALEFVIDNAANAHQTGSRWGITRPVFSTDGKNWLRTEEAKTRRIFSLKNPLGKTVFGFRAPLLAETLHVAYCYPYSQQDFLDFFSSLNHPRVSELLTLGQSEAGRAIPYFHISARGEKTRGTFTPEIWIICREHPGETPASFALEGMVQTLLLHPAGQRLLDGYDFSLVPIVNVDGVEQGYYYHNDRGVNLAEDWSAYAAVETRALKQAIAASAQNKTLKLVINLHASNDPRKGHFFLEMPSNRLQPEAAELQQQIFQATDGNYAQLQGHSRVRLRENPGITGNALNQLYGVYCLYLECNYSRGADGSLVTPESLRETGKALVQGICEVLRPE